MVKKSHLILNIVLFLIIHLRGAIYAGVEFDHSFSDYIPYLPEIIWIALNPIWKSLLLIIPITILLKLIWNKVINRIIKFKNINFQGALSFTLLFLFISFEMFYRIEVPI